jgi:serine/threonine-protein kinase
MATPPTPPDERVSGEMPQTGVAGFRCGEYVLERFLDFGGFSEVWTARHGVTNRLAAVKLLRPQQQQSAEARKRFEREVGLIAEIRHENVVGFLGAGFCEAPSGARVLWLAMELLDGASLRARLNEGERFDEERVVRIGFEICCGVAEAHALEVVHRDLKPENVFLTLAEIVKVIDFGIAKFSGTWGFASTGRMRGVIGTPSYMSPEQIAGGVPSFTSDVYQIGLILYELCTGRYAFGYANGELPTQVQLCQLQTEFMPTPLTEIGIEAEVSQVIMKALSKRPADRYADARELGSALWSALGVLRKRLAGYGLPTNEVNPASSSGEPLGSQARRAYQPAVTPPSDVPPPMPSQSVQVRSDLAPPPLPIWTGEGRPADGLRRMRWAVTEEMTGTEVPLLLRASDAPVPGEVSTGGQAGAGTPEPLVLPPVLVSLPAGARDVQTRPPIRTGAAAAGFRWTLPGVLVLAIVPMLAGWYRHERSARAVGMAAATPSSTAGGASVAATSTPAPTGAALTAPASEPTAAPASEQAAAPTREPGAATTSQAVLVPRLPKPHAPVYPAPAPTLPPAPSAAPTASTPTAPLATTPPPTPPTAPHRLFDAEKDEPGGAP